jgi:hypothetical protein
MDRLCVPVRFAYACIGAFAFAYACACACACACLCVLRAMMMSLLRSCLCASLSLSLGPSLCVCVRRPHPDSEGGMYLWPRGHSLNGNKIDYALQQQIQAFMKQPVATRQAEGTRPPSSHRQSHRRWLLQYMPVCVWGTVYVCCCCSLWRCTHMSVCVCVPVSLCLRPMRHTRAGTCVCITDVCVYLPDSHVSGLSVSSCSYVLD